jgi:prepilin-type N-terminal cleavage/methylation domain-containing protein
MKATKISLHPIVAARSAMRRRMAATTRRELDDAGFTLIELVITVAILPIVVGGISVALISVFTLQGTVSKTVSNSNDELVSSQGFNKDIQSAQQIETVTTPACGSTGTQVLALEWGSDPNGDGGYNTVVSYVQVQTGTVSELVRQQCTAGVTATPTNSQVLAHDVGTPTVTLNPAGLSYKTNQGWTSTQGLYGVTLNVASSGGANGHGSYTYTLGGVPSASSSTGSASQVTNNQNLPGCNLASTGQYASLLCFVDFSSFLTTFTRPSATCTPMKFAIANSPDLLQFCLSVSPTNSITAEPQGIPTYDDVTQGGNSQPYLGNNGFYQGVQGSPAISQRPQPTDVCGQSGQPACTFAGANGVITTLTFTGIQVTNASGQPATNWTLVTGDAESTDSGEWNVYSNTTAPSPVTWQVLPNSSSSFFGNSCYDTQDTANGNSGLFKYTGVVPPTDTSVGNPSTGTGLSANDSAITITAPPSTPYQTNATSIGCEANTQLDKTGALMLTAPEPPNTSAPQSMSITMQGGGYQAVFVGVLL